MKWSKRYHVLTSFKSFWKCSTAWEEIHYFILDFITYRKQNEINLLPWLRLFKLIFCCCFWFVKLSHESIFISVTVTAAILPLYVICHLCCCFIMKVCWVCAAFIEKTFCLCDCMTSLLHYISSHVCVCVFVWLRCDVRQAVRDSVCVQRSGITRQSPAVHQPELHLDRPSTRDRLCQLHVSYSSNHMSTYLHVCNETNRQNLEGGSSLKQHKYG